MRLLSSLLAIPFFLSLATLGKAVAIPQVAAINQTVNTMASGYKNVAYFVNWVSTLLTAAPPNYTQNQG